MREETVPDQAGYPGPMEWLYAWPRRHPWLVDGTLAVLLLAGAANAYLDDAAVLPASLALAGTVAVRRRFPVAAYAVALAIGVAQVIVGIGATFTDSPLQPTFADAGILVLLYTVAAERPRRFSLPGLAACVVLFLAVVVRYNPGGNQARHQLEFFIVTAMLYLLAPASAWVLGDSMGYRRAYSATLEERAVRAERERDAQAQIAAAAERARIARELHDVIAHNLSVIVVQADGGAYAFDAAPEQSRQALVEIGRTGRQALSEMSSLLGVLRTDREAAPLTPQPAVAEIAQLVIQAREAGMNVSQTVLGPVRPLPGGLSLAAYRIVQEALTNVRKHAGPGAAAEVTLRYGRDELLVRVADNGCGAAGLPRYGTSLRGTRAGRDARTGGAVRRHDPGGTAPRRFRGDRPLPPRPRRTPEPPVRGAHEHPGPLVTTRPWSGPGSPWSSAASQISRGGRGADGAAAIGWPRGPDVMVMDVRMPGLDGVAATREICQAGERPRVLILTTFDLDEYAFAALRAGASGFLLKSAPPEELLYAIRSVHNGDSVVAPSTTRRLIGRFMPHLPAPGGLPDQQGLAELTVREREVLAQVGSGLSNAEIAALLHISEATVKTHVGHIMAKLSLRDRIQAVVYAYETGLIAPQGRAHSG